MNVYLQLDSNLIKNLFVLRQKWSALFLRRLKTPGMPLTQVEEKFIKFLAKLLNEEDENIGKEKF